MEGDRLMTTIFQLLPSQLQVFNEQMVNALVRRGEIEIYSDDCEQFLGELFGRIYAKFDMNALDAVLQQPKVFDWLVQQAVANRKLSFRVEPPAPQIVERIVEKPVEIVREVEKPIRQYPNSRITSSTEIAEASRKRVEELQSAAAVEKIVEQQVERYRELKSESLYATGGSGTHSANNHARAQAKVLLDRFVATMHPATKKFLNMA